MKKTIQILLMLTIIAGLFAGCQSGPKKSSTEEMVAIVNEEPILQKDFEEYMAYQKKIAELSGYVAPEMWNQDMKEGKTYEDALKESVLEDMIKNLILVQDAKKQEISLSEDELNAEIEKIKGSEEAKKEFEEQLEKLGIDEKYLKEKILYPNLLIGRYFEKTIEIDDEEAKAFYDEYYLTFNRVRARHILVDDEDKAKAIKKKLSEGGDFEELAREYSTCPSKEKGGDLGYFTMGKMDPAFEKAAFDLKIGEVSNVVKSSFGYHLIKLEDKATTFEANKQEVINAMLSEETQKIIKDLRDKAKVEYKLTLPKEQTNENEADPNKTSKESTENK